MSLRPATRYAPSDYDDASHPTGLWLSELTHAWHVFEERGFSARRW